MAHVSVVKKLERCERIGRARQGDACMLNALDSYQVIKYKIKIKAPFTSNPPPCKLLHITSKALSSAPAPSLPFGKPSPSSSPPLPLLMNLQNLHDHEVQMQLQNLLNFYEDTELSCLKHPPKLQYFDTQAKSLQNIPCHPTKLNQHSAVHENEEASCAGWSPAWELHNSTIEQDGEVKCTPSSAPIQQQIVNKREECPSSPCKLQNATKEERQRLLNGEDGRAGAGSTWKLQSEDALEKGSERGLWETVKKMVCECCGMEEECTGSYEERVRARLRGHWLCGLCEEAVGEEKKRVGGSVQAALAAHMQLCRSFSGRARSRVSPPPAEVAVPHAVCRLLCRHLSTPSPRCPTSPTTSLSRSASCIPSLQKS